MTAHLNKLDASGLKAAREASAARYSALGREWLDRFGVTLIDTRHKALSGRAYHGTRMIKTPWPTSTRSRCYIAAHEIGHIVLGHTDKFCPIPSWAKEFECELFAHSLLRSEGIEVPADMTARAKAYVWRKVQQALRAGAKSLDPSIVNWASETGYRALKSMRPDLFAVGGKRYFAAAKVRVRNAVSERVC